MNSITLCIYTGPFYLQELHVFMHETVMEIPQQDQVASFSRGRTCLFVLEASFSIAQFIDGGKF